jgi:hypothetical protein
MQFSPGLFSNTERLQEGTQGEPFSSRLPLYLDLFLFVEVELFQFVPAACVFFGLISGFETM